MSSSTSPETAWYENTAEGTFHEVLKGSDTERRMQRELRQDGDDENDVTSAYRKVSKSEATSSPSTQPGYVRTGAVKSVEQTPASPATVTQPETPQTPTSDTNNGPLVGEAGAEKQAEQEVELGGAAPGGVKPSATAAKKTAAQASADKAAGK